MSSRNLTNGKSLKAVVGAAHHALRAYCKAYDLRSEGTVQHRYSISPEGRSAAILDSAGNTVEDRSIEEWAAIGPQVRRALIALKFFQERVASSRYHLDILAGRAGISLYGKPLPKGALLGVSANFADTAGGVLAQLDDLELGTVEGWARLGKHVEVEFFQILQSAERYGLREAAQEQRLRGHRLGIIRQSN